MIQSEHRSRLRFFNSREGKIAYVDEGKGPVILLIHGVPTSSWLYRNIIPGLAESGKRVIAIDMLGYGYSDKPEGYEIYNAANHGGRLLELMDINCPCEEMAIRPCIISSPRRALKYPTIGNCTNH